MNIQLRPGSLEKGTGKQFPTEPAFRADSILMTQPELVQYLRIPEISKAENYDNVIENLRRFHNLPSVSICRQPLYPKPLVNKWVLEQAEKHR